jgi:hypothetical protein
MQRGSRTNAKIGAQGVSPGGFAAVGHDCHEPRPVSPGAEGGKHQPPVEYVKTEIDNDGIEELTLGEVDGGVAVSRNGQFDVVHINRSLHDQYARDHPPASSVS